MNNKRFKELLEKALAGSITEDEEKELLRDYINPETAEVFPFIQLACDYKYTPAYYHLGNMYKKGIGCEKSIYLAWFHWMISVQNGGRGFAEIGGLLQARRRLRRTKFQRGYEILSESC